MSRRWFKQTTSVLALAILGQGQAVARDFSHQTVEIRQPQSTSSNAIHHLGPGFPTRELCAIAAGPALLQLSSIADDYTNEWGDVRLLEFSNGSAYLVGYASRKSDPSQYAEFFITLSQRKGAYPDGRYAYQQLGGRMFVQGRYESGEFNLGPVQGGFQLGAGANFIDSGFGASGTFHFRGFRHSGKAALAARLGPCNEPPPPPPPTKPVQPEYWSVDILSSGGSACPVGTPTGVNEITDQGDVSLSIPGLQIQGDRVIERGFCQLALDVVRPKGWQFAVKSVETGYRLQLDQGAIANIIGAAYFQGSPETEFFSTRFEGPRRESGLIQQSLPDDQLSFSDCDGSRALNYKLSIDSRGVGARVAVDENVKINLVWRECK